MSAISRSMRRFLPVLPLTLLVSPLLPGNFVPTQAFAAGTDERIYVVTDYRYVSGAHGESAESGISLCGTRCNAISTNYLNIIEPGGWRLIRVAAGRELNVELKNPFMTGSCICVADEYAVKVEIKNPSRKTVSEKEIKP